MPESKDKKGRETALPRGEKSRPDLRRTEQAEPSPKAVKSHREPLPQEPARGRAPRGGKLPAAPKKAPSEEGKKAPATEKKKSAKSLDPRRPSEEKRREDREEKERLRAEEKEKKSLRKMRRRTLFFSAFCLSLVFILLYVGFITLRITLRSDGTENALPLQLFTEGEREKDRSFSAKEIYRDGIYYLPVSVLEDYFIISEFGDFASRSLMLTESGEWASFTLATPSAVINGEPCSLKGNSFVENGVLYLPLDFYTDKLNCFTLSFSAPLAANVLTFRTGVTPAFLLHRDDAPAPLSPSVLDSAPIAP